MAVNHHAVGVALGRITARHLPTDEEAELWADMEGHDERFPLCAAAPKGCDGHTFTMQVCRECGHEHDGDQPVYRPWPCPTIEAVRDIFVAYGWPDPLADPSPAASGDHPGEPGEAPPEGEDTP